MPEGSWIIYVGCGGGRGRSPGFLLCHPFGLAAKIEVFKSRIDLKNIVFFTMIGMVGIWINSLNSDFVKKY